MKTFLSFLLFVAVCLALVSCNDTGGGGGFIPTGTILAVAQKAGSEETIKVGGLPGSVPRGSTVEVTNLNTGETKTTTANSDGSFDPTFTGDTDDEFNVIVTDDGEEVENIVIGVTLLSDSVEENLAKLGSIPAEIEIRGNRAYVVNGFSDNIQIFDLNQNPPGLIGTIVVPVGSNPMDMAFVDDTTAYVVNNIGQSVARVNVNTRVCEVLIVRAGQGGNPAPCQSVITVAGTPFEEPVRGVVTKGRLYVTNNNLDANFDPMGNGFISVINATTSQFIMTIPATGANTTSMVVIGDTLYATNNGAVLFDPETNEFTCDFSFPPSIDLINTQSNVLFDTIDIPLSPENPTVCLPSPYADLIATPDGRFGYAGLGLVGALLKIDLVSGDVVNGTDDPIVLTNLDSLDLTGGIAIRDNLLFAALFLDDEIAVVDTDTDEVNPFPYIAPFPAGIRAFDPNSEFFDGVQSLAIRPGVPGVDFEGPDIFYITGLSEQLGSVDSTLGLAE